MLQNQHFQCKNDALALGCSGRTAHRRLRDREEAGIWDRLHADLLAALKRDGKLDPDTVIIVCQSFYFLHPLRVMSAVEGEPAKVVAILHDVIEDTAITEEDLRREGFGETVLAALACVTHRKGEPYAEYVVRCKGDEIKLADLEDDVRPSRALLRPERVEPDVARLRRYFLSYKFLTDTLNEDQYRAAMAGDDR